MEERFTLVAMTGGMWEVPAVIEQPVIHLERWQVFELETGEQHLVGWNDDDREGRVSSAVMGFDAVRREAVTGSGRVYELVGHPGQSSDALYVWSTWLRQRGAQAVEVTERFVRLIEEATQ